MITESYVMTHEEAARLSRREIYTETIQGKQVTFNTCFLYPESEAMARTSRPPRESTVELLKRVAAKEKK